MSDAQEPLTPLEVIEYFGELTGIRYRANLVPHLIQQQAAVLARNFELWELRLVYEWTRMKVREGFKRANGFSEASYQWHNMIADGGDAQLGRFQTRLGLALEWARKERPSLMAPVDVPAVAEPVAKSAPVAALVHGEDDTTRARRREVSEGLEALKQSLLGLDAAEVAELPSAAPKARAALPEGEGR